MKTIICCAFIFAITAQCYGESSIRVDHTNYTTHYGFDGQKGLIATQGKEGHWQVQSVDPNSQPQFSYSSRVNKEVFSSDPQRTDPYQFEDRTTRIPVQPVQSRPTRPYNMNQVTDRVVPEQRRTNQPSYPRIPTTTDYPKTHRVSELPTQQGDRPPNVDTVVRMVDDNSNVILYNTNSRPIFQQTHTWPRDNPSSSRHYGTKTSQPAPIYRPTPRYPPTPTYHQPDTRIPTYGYDHNNGGMFVSQSVNTGGPYPNHVQQNVHIPHYYQ